MSPDPARCVKCGHESAYHGMTFCNLQVGTPPGRTCDCDGWRTAVSAPAGLDVGPRIGVRLRDAFWRDSGQYDHLHEHGEMVTHKIGEWCRYQLIGQNPPCPPPEGGYGEVVARAALEEMP